MLSHQDGLVTPFCSTFVPVAHAVRRRRPARHRLSPLAPPREARGVRHRGGLRRIDGVHRAVLVPGPRWRCRRGKSLVVRRRVRLHGALPLAGFILLLIYLPHQLLDLLKSYKWG